MSLLCCLAGLFAPIRRGGGAWFFLVALGAELGGCWDGIGRPIRAEASGAGRLDAGTTQGGDSAASGGTTQGGNSTASSGAMTSSGQTAQAGGPPFQSNGLGGPWSGGQPGGPPMACRETQPSPSEQAAAEESLLSELNNTRLLGNVICGAGTAAVVAPTLVMSDELRCLARMHSNYMLSKGALTSFGVEGGPPARIGQAGGEVIASSEATNPNIAGLLQKLVSGGTDCVNLMDSRFNSVGIGFAVGGSVGYWTIELATQ